MFDLKTIIQLNKLVGETGVLLNSGSLYSAFSSLQYIDDEFLRVCYVARSIFLNHPFVDGNKRTALFLLLICAKNIGHDVLANKSLAEKFVTSAVVNKWNPEKIETEFLKVFVKN